MGTGPATHHALDCRTQPTHTLQKCRSNKCPSKFVIQSEEETWSVQDMWNGVLAVTWRIFTRKQSTLIENLIHIVELHGGYISRWGLHSDA
jgi:hypothetical protein